MFVNEDKKQIKDKSLEYGVLCGSNGRPIAALKVDRANAMYRILLDLMYLASAESEENRIKKTKPNIAWEGKFTTPNVATLSTKEGCQAVIDVAKQENHLLATLDFMINPRKALSALYPVPSGYKEFKSSVAVPIKSKNDGFVFQGDDISSDVFHDDRKLLNELAIRVKTLYDSEFVNYMLEPFFTLNDINQAALEERMLYLNNVLTKKLTDKVTKINNTSLEQKVIASNFTQLGIANEKDEIKSFSIGGINFNVSEARTVEFDKDGNKITNATIPRLVYFVKKNENNEVKRYYINRQTGYMFETPDVELHIPSRMARVFDGKKWHNEGSRTGLLFSYRSEDGRQFYCSPISSYIANNSAFFQNIVPNISTGILQSLIGIGKSLAGVGNFISEKLLGKSPIKPNIPTKEYNRRLDNLIHTVEKKKIDKDGLEFIAKEASILFGANIPKNYVEEFLYSDRNKFVALLKWIKQYGPMNAMEGGKKAMEAFYENMEHDYYHEGITKKVKHKHKFIKHPNNEYFLLQKINKNGDSQYQYHLDGGTPPQTVFKFSRADSLENNNYFPQNVVGVANLEDFNIIPSSSVLSSDPNVEKIIADEIERAQYLTADNAVNAQNQEQNLKKAEAYNKAIKDAQKLKENDETGAEEKNKKKEESEAQKKERDEKVREMVRAQLRQDLKNAVNQLKSVQEKNIFERFLHFLFNLFSDDYKIYKQAVNTIGALNEQGVFAGNQKNVQIVKDAIDEARNKLYIKKPALIQYNVGINLNSKKGLLLS